ncbi:hypothetical protein LLH00_06080 [bacterium]|nr:hypothetical protein [bacterium]
MDWPTATVICSACIGGGTTLAAAVLRFGPSRNGNGNGRRAVSEDICLLRHQRLDEDIQELKAGVSKIHARLDEMILKARP